MRAPPRQAQSNKRGEGVGGVSKAAPPLLLPLPLQRVVKLRSAQKFKFSLLCSCSFIIINFLLLQAAAPCALCSIMLHTAGHRQQSAD